MVKQIATNEFVKGVIEEGHTYFNWLKTHAGLTGIDDDLLSKHLASVDFVSLNIGDDQVMKTAKEDLRQQYAAEVSRSLDEEELVRKSVRGDCCLLEVILHLAKKIVEMTSTSSEDETPKIVRMMVRNAKYLAYEDEIHPKNWMAGCTSHILYRKYEGGEWGLFGTPSEDKSLWQQMNDFVDLHTDEDGEWVD